MAQAAANIAYTREIGDPEIRLTPAARATLAELMKDAEPGIVAIRLFVSGGGCGGMGYGMTFAEAVTDYDSVLKGEGFQLAVDAIALNYLQGCEIDFADGSFVFNNVFQLVGGSGACSGCAGGRGF